MKQLILAIAIVSVTLASCSKTVETPAQDTRPIFIKVQAIENNTAHESITIMTRPI